MKLFKLRTNLATYRSPITRGFASIFVLFLIFYRNKYMHIENQLVEHISTIVCLVLILLSIQCIYISIAEIYYVFKNRHTPKVKQIKITAVVPLDAILKLLRENDIIEIEILSSNRIVKLGASSDCKHNSSVFFDKEYYINSHTYQSLDTLKETLNNMLGNQECAVIAIDGCDARYYNLK